MAIGSALSICVATLAAPANDNFADAEVITGTNIALVRASAGATKETGEPDHADNPGGASVWFQWTAPFSGSVEWTTAGSSFNTLLAAYEGASASNLTVIASSDNYGTNSTSRFVFNAISNSTYYIAVDGFNGATGSISLTFTQTADYFIPANEPRTDFWTTDGPILSTVETNGVLYVGGNFSYVAKKAFSAVALNSSDYTRVEAFPFINGSISAIADDGANGFFVGGRFSRVGDFVTTNLAHIRGDLTVDTSFSAPILSNPFGITSFQEIIFDRSVLYVRGNFTGINGSNRIFGLAAINATNGAVTGWNPPLSTYLNCFTVADDAVYASSGTNVFKIDKITGAVTSFPFVVSGDIRTIAVSDDAVYVGGQFTFTNLPPSRQNLMKVSRYTGVVDPIWNPSPDRSVNGIAVSCDRVYVAGGFTVIAGVGRSSLAGLDPVTGALTWRPDTRLGNMDARFLKVTSDRVYVAGSGSIILQSPRPPVKRPVVVLQALTGASLPGGVVGQMFPQQPDLAGSSVGLVQSGSRVLVAGGLLSEGTPRYNLAAFDAATGRPTDWAPELNATVNAVTATSNRLYIGGGFSTINQQTRAGFGAFDLPSGLLATNWDPHATTEATLGPPEGRQLVLRSNTVYMIGNFTALNGTERRFLGAVDASNAAVTALNVGFTNANAPNGMPVMDALAVGDDMLYVGGKFTAAGGQARSGLAAIGFSSNAVTAWDPFLSFTNASISIHPEATSVCFANDSIFAVGFFNQVGAQVRSGLVQLDPTTGLPTAWQPNYTSGNSGLGFASVVSDGVAVYVSGLFNVPAPFARTNIAAFALSDARATDWTPGPAFQPRVLRAGRKLIVSQTDILFANGGVFPPMRVFGYAGGPRILSEPPNQLIVTNGGDLSLSAVATGQATLSYQWRRNGTNLPDATGPAFVVSGAQTNDSGVYELLVSNGIDSVSSAAANVIVTIPPVISIQPVSQTVTSGATVTLSVAASGYPAPSLQWRLNGVNIPNAISNSYTVTTNAHPTNGGSYSVIAANAGGAISSDIATMVVTTASLTLHDNLPASGFDSSAASGLGSGDNFGATRENGETNHVGKVGGASAWFIWQALTDGVATFRVRGSTFDTLLAVYTGNSVSNLAPVASDEDSGGFLTSQVSFSARAGTNYAIAIDGFAAAQGNIVLMWTNDTSVTAYPRILSHPLSQTVFAGENATFSVGVAAMVPPPDYQWFFGCGALPGATNSSLTVSNVFADGVGNYYLRIIASNGLVALSDTAALQLGIGTQTIARDKPEDLDLDGGGGGSLKGDPKPFVSVGAGDVRTLNYVNSGATTQQGEPSPCGIIGGASQWVSLKPTTNGVFIVDTVGSRIDTVLAVYRKTNFLYLAQTYVTCDDNSAPDRLRSVVKFNATKNTEYLIAVDGAGGAQGDVTLNWRLGIVPGSGGTISTQIWVMGQPLFLSVTVTNGIPPPTFQWRFNGAIIRNATNQTYSITSLNMTNSGLYSVIISNFAGAITNDVANVTVTPPRLELFREISSGTLRFRLQSSTPSMVLEASTNLAAPTVWSSIFTNTNGPLNFLDPATNQPLRFYRTRSFP